MGLAKEEQAVGRGKAGLERGEKLGQVCVSRVASFIVKCCGWNIHTF